MAAAITATSPQDPILRQRICNGAACFAVFFICQHCDCGQRYCSVACQSQAYRKQRRAANRRHQQSEEGRLDHRDRQRQYRCRRRARNDSLSTSEAATSVTDEPSPTIPFPAKIQLWEAEPQPAPTQLYCRICGRASRFINPFPRHSWIQKKIQRFERRPHS
jgi:hypothetical protein